MSTIAAVGVLSVPFPRLKESTNRRIRASFGVFSIIREERKSHWAADRCRKTLEHRGKFLDMNQVIGVAQYNLKCCYRKACHDILTIMLLHDKVVEALNPFAHQLKLDFSELQGEMAQNHNQVHISEAPVSTTLESNLLLPTATESVEVIATAKSGQPRKGLNVSGPVQPYHANLRNYWYPVTFSVDLKNDSMVPIDCFEEPWVIFRGKDGKPGRVQNTCAHRACPLHLGSVREGRVQCPYHGWEYSTDGKCEKMPSTRLLNVRIRTLPCCEQEGLIWVWPGDNPPLPNLPSLLPPSGFQIHAEIVMELPVEHGLLLDNLLDLAHAPFTHSATFAKAWAIPSLVEFFTPVSGLQGHWQPYPIDTEFRPPCAVLSLIGMSKPGKLEGKSTRECATHLHQLHVCLPSSRQKTRLLYRMSLDFAPMLKHIPLMQHLWRHFAEKVLNEDLRLVIRQQERMLNGANVWNWPVPYDKLGVRYRLWRNSVER